MIGGNFPGLQSREMSRDVRATLAAPSSSRQAMRHSASKSGNADTTHASCVHCEAAICHSAPLQSALLATTRCSRTSRMQSGQASAAPRGMSRTSETCIPHGEAVFVRCSQQQRASTRSGKRCACSVPGSLKRETTILRLSARDSVSWRGPIPTDAAGLRVLGREEA